MVERAIRVVRAEGTLVRPLVPHVEHLVHHAAFRLAERLAENRLPLPVHDDEQRRHIELRRAIRRPRLEPRVAEQDLRVIEKLIPPRTLQLTLDERLQASGEKFERLADAIVVGDGHDAISLAERSAESVRARAFGS